MADELTITNKRNEVTHSIEKTVSDYYNLDLTQNTEENLKKKQNIAMFVSKLVTTLDKNKQPAILSATPDSIRECALAFVNGDFDFFRNQAYLISYGTSLQFIVSKDGLVNGAKRILQDAELFSDIVYKGDIFEYEKIGGRTIVKKHVQPLENITGKTEDIIGAYACLWRNGEQVEANIMTMQEIVKALETAHRSITDFHKNNPKIMFGKFPLRQLCKKIINQNVAPEVAKVLSDEESVPVMVEASPANNAPVSIDFAEPEKKITKKATSHKEEVEQPVEEPTSKYDVYEEVENNIVPESVSMFDLVDTPFGEPEKSEETKRVKYVEWKNGLREQLPDWQSVKDSYDDITKTILIKRVG